MGHKINDKLGFNLEMAELRMYSLADHPVSALISLSLSVHVQSLLLSHTIIDIVGVWWGD